MASIVSHHHHHHQGSTSPAPPQKRIRKLPPEKRQKVSTACDSCKKRKFKCTGSNPCDLCVRKGYECTYTVIDKRSLKSERLQRLKEQKRLQEEIQAKGGSVVQSGSEGKAESNYVHHTPQQNKFQQPEFIPLPYLQQQRPQAPQQQPSFAGIYEAAQQQQQHQPYPKQQITPPDAPPYQSPQQQVPQYQQHQQYQAPPNFQQPPPPPPPPHQHQHQQYPPYHQFQRASVPISPNYPPQPYPHQGFQPYSSDPRPVYQGGPSHPPPDYPPYNQAPFYGPPGHQFPPGSQLPHPVAAPAASQSPPIPPSQQRSLSVNYQHETQQASQYEHEHQPLPSCPLNKKFNLETSSKEDVPEDKKHLVTQSSPSGKNELDTPHQDAGIPTPNSPASNLAEKSVASSIPKFLQPLLSFSSILTKKRSTRAFGQTLGEDEASEGTTTPNKKRKNKDKNTTALKLNSQDEANAVIDEEIANEISGEIDSLESKDGVSNQAGKSCILLNDKSGTFRYMGETSPLSVLYETRNIFYQYVGKTKLTEDLRGCPVVDKPLKLTAEVVMQLPAPDERDVYITQFKRNINDTFFVYDLDKFYSDIVDRVYSDPINVENETKLVQLYFVLAIGATYFSFSNKDPQPTLGAQYFESGLLILKSLVEDSEMWCVLAHYLQFHYYQSILKKSTAWIHLNLAIKFAQSLGLHRNFVNEQFSNLTDECEYRKRIFRSLYSSDRISSVFIGRPLAINDYDWDDPTRYKSSKTLISSSLNFNAKCQIELARISHLIGKIVANFYQNRIIDINRTKNLAVQLKLWSKDLDSLLSVENLFKPHEITHNEDGGNTQIVLMMHLLQLFAIMLLCRPFFLYDAVSQVNATFPKTITLKDKSSSRQFIHAATKASILAVKLMNHYINTSFKEVKRMECYIIITCCFYSSIFIGISILNGGYQFDDDDDEGQGDGDGDGEEGGGRYTETEMMNLLRNAVYILNHYSTCNKGAERYAEIGSDLIDALADRHKHNSTTDKSEADSAGEVVGSNSLLDPEEVMNYFNFTDDANAQDLRNLIDFQQFFVSSDITGGSIFDSSNMPYDYGNYDLFFGDKY
ncbi:hypothetical protein CANMA_002660 [Candida margitis]|uniref:uncharacterized protein n=1 Tax=Candida margitis TaxID=1775924 RepID=UPI002228046D|nr:uncharacterized protein CANMA_002660 [Candida margitis]KAI5967892.1 hypothetical protein CANMA_002660 [Candida margitis]